MIELILTQGQIALIDDSDFELLTKFKWHAWWSGNNFYARTNSPPYYLHKFLLPKGKYVDHINGNTLDNQRSNLRNCTNQENNYNKRPTKGKYKGVSFCLSTGRWRAQISVEGRNTHIGRYDTEIEAAKAYDVKAKIIQGEFAYLNFPSNE